MKILFLESFFGGSHKDFALGFKQSSQHEVDLVTLPARFWKWRMRGAGLFFAEKVKNIEQYDAVLATDMMDLTDLKGIVGRKMPPVLFYFHENQLDYPLSEGEKRDFHLGFTNIVSAAAADAVLFNSKSHMDRFFDHADDLLCRLPDHVPLEVMNRIKSKVRVAYPGCRFAPGPVDVRFGGADSPLVIWNHRWEHDKNPEGFYSILKRLKNQGTDFSLAVLGENFSEVPSVFKQIKEEFKSRIRVFGYIESREEYVSWLKKGDLLISCANQENFGISVVEATRFGCLPVLPERLSYPELIPSEFHAACLYQNEEQAVNKIGQILSNPLKYNAVRNSLSKEMEHFAWDIRVKQYDKALKNLQKSP